MIDLYSRLDVGERARGALEHHARLPIPPPKPEEEKKQDGEEPGGDTSDPSSEEGPKLA
jgi:hypothetical protein